MRISKSLCTIVLSCATLIESSSAFAWGERAHQTIGEIASKNLTATAAQSIIDIMGPERLAQTAIWADEVRDDIDFAGFDDYHIVTISTGFTYATRPEADKDPKDATTVLKKYPELLKDPKVPRSVKMIALRYIVHVIGDIHQPLHVSNRFDFGGNSCRVETSPGKTNNLHRYWDRELVEDDMDRMKIAGARGRKFYRFDEYASDIVKANPLSATELKKVRSGTYLDWMHESMGLRSAIYPDPKPTEDSKREYCLKASDSAKIPVLTEAYKNEAMKIVQKQILFSGLRLAETLNQIFSGPSQPGTNAALTKAEILKQLDLTN